MTFILMGNRKSASKLPAKRENRGEIHPLEAVIWQFGWSDFAHFVTVFRRIVRHWNARQIRVVKFSAPSLSPPVHG